MSTSHLDILRVAACGAHTSPCVVLSASPRALEISRGPTVISALICRASLACLLIVLTTSRYSQAADQPNGEYNQKLIPEQLSATYANGELVKLSVDGRNAYVVKPKGKVDPQRRWVWISPFWLGINDGHGSLHHRFYVERVLEAGFHVAGIDIGTSCGSPSGAQLAHSFYERMISDFGLNRRTRLIGQSNGGLMAYAWAFRHPECVDRIFGIYPVTDFRTWPTLPVVITAPAPGLGYNLTLAELTKRMAEFNPVDNLAPLAKAKVKILHIHGDRDELVPLLANSARVIERYKILGGDAELSRSKVWRTAARSSTQVSEVLISFWLIEHAAGGSSSCSWNEMVSGGVS